MSHSSENFKFAQLPAPRKEFVSQTLLMREFFTGQHEKVLAQNTSGETKVISRLGVMQSRATRSWLSTRRTSRNWIDFR